jgi:hypothetical protein
MGYLDNDKEYMARGIDWDLYGCLEFNPQDDFTVEDIEQVLAVWECENDGDDWRWILKFKNSTFGALQGGCDYTGWDCQSWASSEVYATPEETFAFFEKQQDFYHSEKGEALTSLRQQLVKGKSKTWHEQTGENLGAKLS